MPQSTGPLCWLTPAHSTLQTLAAASAGAPVGPSGRTVADTYPLHANLESCSPKKCPWPR